MEEIHRLTCITLCVGLSTACFNVCSKFAKRSIPDAAVKKGKEWLWKNIFISFNHSLLTGLWSMYCIYMHPDLGADLIGATSLSAQILVCVSLGYFIHDTYDIWTNKPCKELLLHHAVLLSCFIISLSKYRYMGFCCVALFVEVNSIFLHLRQLMLLAGIPKSSCIYRLNGLMNLGTYIVCRILTVAFLARWLMHHRDSVDFWIYSTCSTGLSIIMIMNIVLLWRLLRSDYLPNARLEGAKEE